MNVGTVLLVALPLSILCQDGCCENDLDGDGWTIEDGDCDDGNAEVYPGATETINGVDDDCDGAGYHGDYTPAESGALEAGDFEFTTLTIPEGVDIAVTGSSELRIWSLESATIAGTFDLSGGDGEDGGWSDEALSSGGTGGGGGGGQGGDGAVMWISDGGQGEGLGGGYPGLGGVEDSMVGSGGGGGGHSTEGSDGGDGLCTADRCGSEYTVGGGSGGDAYGDDSLPELLAGSGGGGGGAGVADNADGAGAGGGGGAFYLWSPLIDISGRIEASGGAGGHCIDGSDGGAGGGGAGGTIWLAAHSITLSGTLLAEGGEGGTTVQGDTSAQGGVGGSGAAGRIWLDAPAIDAEEGVTSPEWLSVEASSER